MPRRENPIDPRAPYAGLATLLRRAREEAGLPPYKALARRTGFSVSALSQAASGRRLPSLELTVAYGSACGGDPEVWSAQWSVARARHTAADPAGSGPGLRPDPTGCRTVGEFVRCLRDLKAWAGDPSLGWIARHMAGLLGSRVGRSTVGDALNPNRRSLPSLPLVTGFVHACLHFGAVYGGRGSGQGVPAQYRDAWHGLRQQPSGAARDGGRPTAAPERSAGVSVKRPAKRLGLLDHGLPAEAAELADALRERFLARGCSLRQAAMAVFVSPATMSRYLGGRRIPPRGFVDGFAAFTAADPADAEALRGRLDELRWRALNATGPRTALTVELAERLDDTHSRTGALDAEVTRLRSEVTDLTVLLRQAYEDAQRLGAARRSTWAKAPAPAPVPVYGDVFAGLRAPTAPQPRRLAVAVRRPSGAAGSPRVVRAGSPAGSRAVAAVSGAR